MTRAFFDAPGGCSQCAKGFVDKVSAGHMQPLTDFATVAFYTAGWFKLHLDLNPWHLGYDWESIIFGNTSSSLCAGGDGGMKQCVLVPGS